MIGEDNSPSKIPLNKGTRDLNSRVMKWELYEYPKTKTGTYYANESGIAFKQKLEETHIEQISRTPFVLCGRTKQLEDGTVYYTVRYGAGDSQKEFIAKQSDLLIKNSLKSILTGHGINVTDNKMLSNALEYISLCIHQYGERLKTTVAVVSNGWNEDCTLFTLGNYGIRVDEIFTIHTLVTAPEHTAPFHTNGSITIWVKAVAPIMDYDVVRFLFYDAMTAPLKKLLKIESHTFVHHGASSSGKTAIENVISSTMGDPKPLEFIANSTKNAILAHVSGMCDIPVDIEEATEEKARIAMADAVYDIANGKEKGRCGIDGKLRTDIRTFRTTVHVTCENPLRDHMKNAGAAYRAQHISDRLPEGLGETVSNTKKEIQENYGFFFPLYLQHIIKNKARLNELYSEARRKIDTNGIPKENQDIAERSKNIYAGIMVAGYLCEEVFKEIGLPLKEKIEVERIVNKYFGMCVINDPVEPDYMKALRVISDWIITDRRKFLISDVKYIDFDIEVMYKGEPKFEVCGKITDDYIDIIGTEFTKKMKECGFSPIAIKKAFVENEIIVCVDSRKNGDYSVNVNGEKSNGIRIIRKAMEDKLGLDKIRDLQDSINDPEIAKFNKILRAIELLKNLNGAAHPFTIGIIAGIGEISNELAILEEKGRIVKRPDGQYI